MAKRSPRVAPVPRPEALDHYAGEWVAVKAGEIIAHAESAGEVVQQLRDLGEIAQGAVLQRAATTTEALAVGLG